MTEQRTERLWQDCPNDRARMAPATRRRRLAWLVAATGAFLLPVASARTQDGSSARLPGWFERSALTGDWNGLRSESSPLRLEAWIIFDWSTAVTGGLGARSVTRSLSDANLTLDLEHFVGWRGATFFADFYPQTGRDGSAQVGDIQAFSNIDADNVTELAEFWIGQRLWSDRLRLKVGKVDANSEFASPVHGGEFINSSTRGRLDRPVHGTR